MRLQLLCSKAPYQVPYLSCTMDKPDIVCAVGYFPVLVSQGFDLRIFTTLEVRRWQAVQVVSPEGTVLTTSRIFSPPYRLATVHNHLKVRKTAFPVTLATLGSRNWQLASRFQDWTTFRASCFFPRCGLSMASSPGCGILARSPEDNCIIC